MASGNRYWLLAVIGFLAVNWLGDSLDGTLARVRQRQRPRYGFYVDHMADSIGSLFLMGGLGLSGYMHPGIAIGLLVLFCCCSPSKLILRLTRWGNSSFHSGISGRQELRLLLAVGNLALLRWHLC